MRNYANISLAHLCALVNAYLQQQKFLCVSAFEVFFTEEYPMESNNTGYMRGFVAGALLGGIAGAVVALLFAPKPGRELRQEIAQRTEELYNRAQDALNPKTVGEELPPVTFNQGKLRAQEIVQTARQQAEQLLSSAEQVLRDARSRASQAKEQIQENIARVRQAAEASVEAFKSELRDTE